MKTKYSVTIWHGESQTQYHLIRQNSKNEEDWEVIQTYSNKRNADNARDYLNAVRKLRPVGAFNCLTEIFRAFKAKKA